MHCSITRLKLVEAASGLLLIAFLLMNCKKDYSYEGGTADFSLLNTNGSCSNPVISGDYTKGSALGASNIVQLQVYVTTAGRFSLQTNSRNGFLFSVTGSFSDTGIQTLTLTATGKPDSTGDFIFIPELAVSCAFPVSVSGQQVPETGYTIAGAPNACSNVQVSGEYQIKKILTGTNTIVVNVNVLSTGDYIIQTDTLDGISFYAAGHFNLTGNQTVTLTGSGTPLLPQYLQFNLVGNGTACTFPLTVENAGDSATYSIASGVDHCVGQIAGVYTAGTPLNATNTFTLTVYCSVAGLFSISTQPVDGVVFSYTGRFTRLGTNFVTLTGHGTPVNVGSFTLTPEIIGPAPLGGESCAFILAVK
jgi:hypothetical protein